MKKALEARVSLAGIRYRLDSKTAICWIQNRGEWKQFVRNRVNEILKLRIKKNGDTAQEKRTQPTLVQEERWARG